MTGASPTFPWPLEPAQGSGDDAFAREGPHLFTVRELTSRIRTELAALGRVSVEGEVTRISRPNSGHLYFSLKDIDAVLACTVWKSKLGTAVPFELAEGRHVIAHGHLDVYAPRGAYSLLVDRLEERGRGALLVRLERLKEELMARGWFDRQRPIPRWPARVGVVASRDSAAFQDFLRTRSLRWPGYPVRLAHTSVQGAAAAREIADAILRLDQSGVDVLVLIRGGGSLEDLWAFNEPAVLDALWQVSVPVVSGIGHETDVTLADHVADLRAHTPTDAAQRVIPDRAALLSELERAQGYLSEALEGAIRSRVERLARAGRARVLRSPDWMLADRRAALGHLAQRLSAGGERALARSRAALAQATARLSRQSPAVRLERSRGRLSALASRLGGLVRERTSAGERRLERAEASLAAISPLAVLERGYSITRRQGGAAPLTSAAGLAPGERIETWLASGRIDSTVDAAWDADSGADAGDGGSS